MQEKIRYTKTGKKVGVFEFEGRLHEKILLTKEQYAEHILKKHPEITLEIIENTLKTPDIVTKKSRSKKEHFYQKKIDKTYFFVVVSFYKNIKNIRFILTAYSVNSNEYLKDKNIYYVYKRKLD
ncbi:helicase [Sebaldella sp. S0638]|uniref:helicase n=1 Tax=Sebaldella sp. S0638 TaxID=2957809 RepID=UPI0020A09D70|nr:helicase [Sebaldella sp. S0638]MCP1225570.1 helicase [Sebaldella sp. S0638]